MEKSFDLGKNIAKYVSQSQGSIRKFVNVSQEKKNLEICQLFACKNRKNFQSENQFHNCGLCKSVAG